jgi:hypothetical protein
MQNPVYDGHFQTCVNSLLVMHIVDRKRWCLCARLAPSHSDPGSTVQLLVAWLHKRLLYRTFQVACREYDIHPGRPGGVPLLLAALFWTHCDMAPASLLQ